MCAQTGFDMDDVVRKYIRYTLNEKQFNPDVVVDLIHLRKASMLEDAEVAEILNEISRRIVREKGITSAAYSNIRVSTRYFQNLSSGCFLVQINYFFLLLPFK
jgi:hypothetical protein